MLTRILSSLTALAAVVSLSACAGETFETSYDEPVAADISRNWNIVDVRVDVPRTLSVSEARTYLPKADIVWREDPAGNRYQQVAEIVESGVAQGAAPLNGPRDVRLEVTVGRFHAMTSEAEALNYDVGVHNIDFTLRAVDARSGAVLAAPAYVQAAFPALTGARMTEARLRGETQKSQITRHLSAVAAGWLGIGPDPRGRFVRIGG